MIFGGNEISARVLEGEEEEAYWTEFSIKKANKWSRNNNRNKRFKGKSNFDGKNGACDGPSQEGIGGKRQKVKLQLLIKCSCLHFCWRQCEIMTKKTVRVLSENESF